MGLRKGKGRKAAPPKNELPALKVRLRGKDNSALSIQQLGEGLLEAAQVLKQYEDGYRIKSATIYLTMIDEHGTPVCINKTNELTIYPYQSAADEHGV
ncbi:hypothetical protein HNQ36_002680 [Afipia massiliensis]|uniref:Uncharacterized protein n=1 Tax=Afipia massiliensis TaxID=211460 RepID=A0A840N7L3_9BRAD|nr:hypothetical protein [Afipia massiliensis]MBB5052706.1 hypothetical protein [Afipia massiliensis]